MKGFSKIISAMAAFYLLAAPVLNPLTVGAQEGINEEQNLRKEIVIDRMEQRSTEMSFFQSPSYSAQTVATEAIYKQQINYNRIHEYHFTTGGGTFTIEPIHGDVYEVDYFIYEMNSEEIIEPTDDHTFDLPDGVYYFVVMGYSEEPVNYEYKLKGPFSTIPDPVLPKLNVTNPATEDIRLPKNSPSAYSVSGSSDAVQLSVSLNDGEEVPLTAPGTFKWDHLNLARGYNSLIFNAMKLGGNSVSAFYSITLPGVTRIEGKDRYQVSSNISSSLRYWGYGSGTVIITRGDLYPDAVSGGPLAYAEDAPILLTHPNSLSQSVITELKNIQPYRAIILGGTGSVSSAVEKQLADLGIEEIDRIGGKDRYVVSASIAERVVDYWESDTALIASGEAFPDALSASTIAGPAGMPILLVRPTSLPTSMETFIKNNPQISNFIIVGGPAAVSDSVANKVKQIRPKANLKRIGGQNRYEVSVNVAKYSIEQYGMDASSLTFARGDLFPDALSGSPLANFYYAPVILTPANGLHDQVSSFLTGHSEEIDHMYIFGGTGAVSSKVEQQLSGFIR